MAIIGPNSNAARLGDYSSKGANTPISIFAGIKKLLPKATVIFDEGKDIDEALKKAKGADVIIVAMGESAGTPAKALIETIWTSRKIKSRCSRHSLPRARRSFLCLENGRSLSIPRRRNTCRRLWRRGIRVIW